MPRGTLITKMANAINQTNISLLFYYLFPMVLFIPFTFPCLLFSLFFWEGPSILKSCISQKSKTRKFETSVSRSLKHEQMGIKNPVWFFFSFFICLPTTWINQNYQQIQLPSQSLSFPFHMKCYSTKYWFTSFWFYCCLIFKPQKPTIFQTNFKRHIENVLHLNKTLYCTK